jgi:hypothetical protein
VDLKEIETTLVSLIVFFLYTFTYIFYHFEILEKILNLEFLEFLCGSEDHSMRFRSGSKGSSLHSYLFYHFIQPNQLMFPYILFDVFRKEGHAWPKY